MSRQPRIIGEYMHVIVRGNGKQILFEDSADRKKYLYLLEKYAGETGVAVLAYCLMENHVHILVHDPDGGISALMKKLGVGYARHYNQKYERTGHLFQGRYKSEIISDDAYLLSAFRYILNNPEKAGICRAEEFPWSSYREYTTKEGLTDTEMLREMIGGEAELCSFLKQQDDTEHIGLDIRLRDDTWALATMQKALGITNGTQLQQYDRARRDRALVLLKEKGLTIRQIERLTGINRGVIQKAKAFSEHR